MRKLLLALAGLLLLISALTTAAQATAQVRVAHFSPDAPTVDIYIDGELAFTELDFPEVTAWTPIEIGTRSIAVTLTGASIGQAVIGPVDVTFTEGDFLTIAALGLVENSTLTAQVIEENYAPTREGEARFSVFHAIQDAPPVDVSANGEALVELLAYPDTLVEGGDGFATIDVVAQEYDISATLSESGTEIFSIEDIATGDNRNYFIAAVGTAANPQFVLVTTDIAAFTAASDDDMTVINVGAGVAKLRVAHFAPGAPPVDIYLNGTLAVRDLAFPSIGEYMDVNADMYEVQVVAAGATPTESILDVEVPIEADSVNLVSAVGVLDQGTFGLQLVNENPNPTAEGEARISVFHALPFDESVSLQANDALLVENLFYPQFAGANDGYATVDVIAQEYDLSMTSQTGSINLNVGSLTAGAGRHYLIAVVGLESSPLFILEATNAP